MYSEGSAVCKDLTIGIEISPTTSLIFTGGGVKKCEIWRRFIFEPPAFENAARYPNSETNVQCCDDCPMSLPRLVKLSPRTPEKALSVCPTP